MADAPRLLTPEEVDGRLSDLDGIRERSRGIEPWHAQREREALHTLRAAWDDRDGYREALRDAQPLICGEYCGDAYHVETCLAIRRLLGEPAGQDGG